MKKVNPKRFPLLKNAYAVLETGRAEARKSGRLVHVNAYDRMQYRLGAPLQRLARWRTLEMALLTLVRSFEAHGLSQEERQRVQRAIDMLDDQLR